MATNVYFNGNVKSEQDLYEDLTIESLKMYGQDIVYIPRQEITRDEILNESYNRFSDSYVVEMYLENQDGFEGDGELLSKFGLEIRDTANFIVSRKRWDSQVGTYLTAGNGESVIGRPSEGDLLYLPMASSLFEITFVEDEVPFYQLKNVPVYQLKAELFEYTDEDFDTDIDAIDRVETVNATSYTYGVVTGSGAYKTGETVYQWTGEDDPITGDPINIEGEVAHWEDTGLGGNLTVVSLVTTDGKFAQFYKDTSALKQVIGTESGTAYNIEYVDIKNNFNQDGYANNDIFDAEAQDIIDWTETNPFGDP